VRAVRRFVLGTAGHVDHGKTTLVRALTGVDTDRLPEEKRRGITIELGFAPWSLGDGVEVSVIDVPGHRRLVHTMIAGAIGMEVVLLVVAADEGVMPQTREHVAACELLGIRRAVVAVTKVDKAGEELASLAGEEARELLGDRFEAEVVLCSARTGEGIDAVRGAVRRALLALPPPALRPRARLAIDRAFSVRGAGTVVTGTLVEGRLRLGARLFVAGETGSLETSARGLHVHDRAVDEAEAPTRLAVNLAGLGLEAVHRGDVVTDDPAVGPTRALDVVIRGGARPKSGAAVEVYVGTARAPARIVRVPGGAEEAADAPVLARLRLARPLVVVGGDRFVLRGSDVEGPAGAVLGGGTVLDARPPRQRPRGKRRAVLEALVAGAPPDVVRALVREAAPRPLVESSLAARFPLEGAELARAAEKLVEKGELARIKGPGWVERATLIELAVAARRLVGEHHAQAPLDRGLPLETLRKRLGALAGAEAAEEAIRLAAATRATTPGEPIAVEGDVARLASFGGAAVGGAAGDALERASRALAGAGLKGVTEHAVGEATGASSKDVRAVLARLVRDGAAAHAGELWFGRAAFDDLGARVLAHLAKSGRLTIADFKALTGLGRRQAIPLLELLDREGVTKREGDDRVAGK
jgi:selenocysteine-specific elongation factor